jgi:hypothetical protein
MKRVKPENYTGDLDIKKLKLQVEKLKGLVEPESTVAEFLDEEGVFWDELVNDVFAHRLESIGSKLKIARLSFVNKQDVALWTNRVAVWRFFERFTSPIMLSKGLDFQDRVIDKLQKRSGADWRELGDGVNPFSEFGLAFGEVMKVWNPYINKIVSKFVDNTPDGRKIKGDIYSLALMGFLQALEYQGLAIITDCATAQGVPFPLRLSFAIRNSINAGLKDLTLLSSQSDLSVVDSITDEDVIYL